jgi:hypothetical protein
MEKDNKTDIVYVLGKGSAWDNNELRFSIRSLVKNLQGFRKIYVIGEKPFWLKKAIHIPCEDFFKNGQNNDGNIIKKVLRACEIPGLSTDFLFINDDHFIMKPIHVLDIPPYQKGDMATFEAKYFELNFWRLRLWRTRNILVKKGYTAYHYDCHTPILFNKKKFPEVISKFDYERLQGYTMKSLYGNVIYGAGVPLGLTNKKTIFRNYLYDDIVARLKNCTYASVNDTGMNIDFKMFLHINFPESSQYEKIPLSNSFQEIIDWMNTGRDYIKGCELYLKYGKNVNIKRFLLTRTSRSAQKKLEIHLLKLIHQNI